MVFRKRQYVILAYQGICLEAFWRTFAGGCLRLTLNGAFATNCGFLSLSARLARRIGSQWKVNSKFLAGGTVECARSYGRPSPPSGGFYLRWNFVVVDTDAERRAVVHGIFSDSRVKSPVVVAFGSPSGTRRFHHEPRCERSAMPLLRIPLGQLMSR